MVDVLTWVLNLRDYNLFNMASRLMSNLEYIMGVKIGYSERADVDWSWVYEIMCSFHISLKGCYLLVEVTRA